MASPCWCGPPRWFGKGSWAPSLRQAIGEATSHRTKACLTGLGVATALQSSSATGLLVVAFAERGLIALAPALAVMLGADIGSTLVVQALSFNTAALVPVLMIVGVGVALTTKTGLWQQVGRIVIGLALMILSLSLIVGASQPLREAGVFTLVMERLADDPALALAMGALFTWIAHSSVAVILFVISLAGAGVLSLPLALALVLGANVGSALIPIGLALRSPAPADTAPAERWLHGRGVTRWISAGPDADRPVRPELAAPVPSLAGGDDDQGP